MTARYNKLGELLIREGLVDAEGVSRGLEVHLKTGMPLAKALADLGLADESAIAAAVAKANPFECLGASPSPVSPDVAALLPAEFCRKHGVAPLSVTGKRLRLAMADPLDQATIQDVMFRCSKQIVPVVATYSSILALLAAVAEPEEPEDPFHRFDLLTAETPEGEVEAIEDDELDAAQLEKRTTLAPVVRLVNLILSEAVKENASDIHIEPKIQCLQVRQRVDGLLHDVFSIPKRLQDATISRLKIISGMDIADRRRPQDGRSTFSYKGQKIDLRVSTLPTQLGEKVVVRLLSQQRMQLAMESLDLSPANLEALRSLLLRPQGMILVTGPTSSGKSTTLYTALNWVKTPTKNIITVEDPIEYQLEGITQVQINPRAGVTFASGLRSILRQDPNVILVAEIRDKETASIAFAAAQTGHLMLSTLHTNDAPATVTRLIDLGVEPFMVASALNGVLAQRLVRKVCQVCAAPHQPSAETIRKIGADRLPARAQWTAGRGCSACKGTGYKGRVAIHELLQITEELHEMIGREESEHEIRRVAKAAGMRTLLEDGIEKAAQGLTTLDAVLEIIVPEDAPAGTAAATENWNPAAVTPVPSTRVDPAPDAPAAAARRADLDAPAVVPSGASGPRKRILVVEDSRTVAAVVKYFLELDGFEVILADDGLVGLETAKREHPDVIVTDYNMPGMDGLEMVKALRADAATRDIAISILTSDTSVESETLALAGGADDYIAKPVEPRRLAARVKALIARTSKRQLTAAS